MGAVDEDCQMVFVVEKVGAGPRLSDGVLTTIGLAVAMLLDISQSGMLQRTACRTSQLGAVLLG